MRAFQSISHLSRLSRSARRAAAFTLTELLIAVGVLVVVVVAVAQIFGAASKVSAVAEANADLLQTAAAIEQQIRADFANLPENGFLVLQQVEVNRFGNAQTLDPALGAVEMRADQIAFFTRGVRTTQQFTGYDQLQTGTSVSSRWLPQSAVARIYYGHGVQTPTLREGFGALSYGGSNAPLVPWKGGAVETQLWTDGTPQPGAQPRVSAAKPSQWPLARIATLMGSDGFGSRSFADGGSVNATQTLFTRAGGLNVFPAPLTIVGSTVGGFDSLWTSSRVDICKWQMDDLFSQTAYQYNNAGGVEVLPYIRPPADILSGPSTRLRMLQTLSPWAIRATQQNPADASNPVTNHFVGYPRVEKAALGPSRSEQMLAAPVLAANCSNFKIEWTWNDGVGRNLTLTGGVALTGDEQIGMYVRPGAARPWFGLDDGLTGSNVAPASSARIFPIVNNFDTTNNPADWGGIGRPLANADNAADHVYCAVEGPRNPATGDVIWRTSTTQDSKRVYQAVFGLNQDDPGATSPSEAYRGPYTPLPSALRITLRLHDTLGRIEGGREYQFIVELPKR
jgi:type II secretory pathway pseudopilin PulG